MDEAAAAEDLPPVRFAGKVDGWFYLLVVIGNLGSLGSLASAFDSSKEGGVIVLVVVLSCLFLLDGITVPVLVHNYVEFDDAGNLKVVFGWKKVVLPVERIRDVRETCDLLASLAASFDRIEIKAGYDELMVAVKDKDGFFREAARRCPNAAVAGADRAESQA